MPEERKSQAQSDYEGLKNLTDRMKDVDDDGKNSFIQKVMGSLGHKPVTNWLDADDNGSGNNRKDDKPWGY